MLAPRTNRRAQVFLEFALVLPLCLTMFTAMVDMGLFLHRYVSVQTAVREGMRGAATGLTDDQIKATIVSSSESAALTPADVQVIRIANDPALATLDGEGGPIAIGEQLARYESIEVRVDTQHKYLVPAFFPGNAFTRIYVYVKTLRPLR